jgi:spore coat protein H
MTTRTDLTLLLSLVVGGCGGGDPGGPGGDADAAPDTDAAPPGPGSDYIFDLARLHHFEIELADADWQWLKENAVLEEYRPASLVFEGRRYDGAAIRFKGDYGSLYSCFDGDTQICPKLSIKLSVNTYDRDQRFFGLRKLNFNSSVRDPSLMHEVVGYRLFRDMGVPAPRASHASLAVNGEELGLFVLVEEVDKEFLQDHFADDEGNLYKSVWPQHDSPEPYIEALHTNEDAADVSDMLAFHDMVEGTSDETFLVDAADWLDPAALATYLAVDRATANTGGISGFYCYPPDLGDCRNQNYYWYHVPADRMVLIPWDLDYALYDLNTDLGRAENEPNPGGCEPVPACEIWHVDCDDPENQGVYLLPPQCDRLYGMIHRASWQAYLAELGRLADGPLAQETIVPWMDAVRAKIARAVRDDAFGPSAVDYAQHNASLDLLLADELEAIRALLASE